LTFKINEELGKEIIDFSNLIADVNFLNITNNSKLFWKNSQLTKLKALARILMNINCS
jgi:hypothetical protein